MSFISTKLILQSLPEEWKDRFSDVKRIKTVAERFILSCFDKTLQKRVVLKICSGPVIDSIENELNLADMFIKHPNISDRLVKILDRKYVKNDENDDVSHTMFIIMDEYKYDLRQWLEKYYSDKPVPQLLIYKILNQLNEAIEVIHSYIIDEKHRILHRDIKLENIFVEDFNEETQYIHIRLGDFGGGVLVNSTHDSSFRGTQYYLAPEVELEQKWSTKSDIWSAGIVILRLITKDFEYKMFFKLLEKMLTKERENRYIFKKDSIFTDIFKEGHVKEQFLSVTNELEYYLFYLDEKKEYNLALDVMENYKYFDSLSLFRKSRFHHLKGYFFGKLNNDNEQQRNEYCRALEIYPYSADTFSNLGYMGKNIPQSIKYYQKSLEIDPNEIQVLHRIGLLCIKNNQQEGLKYLHRALELDENNDVRYDIAAKGDFRLKKKLLFDAYCETHEFESILWMGFIVCILFLVFLGTNIMLSLKNRKLSRIIEELTT